MVTITMVTGEADVWVVSGPQADVEVISTGSEWEVTVSHRDTLRGEFLYHFPYSYDADAMTELAEEVAEWGHSELLD